MYICVPIRYLLHVSFLGTMCPNLPDKLRKLKSFGQSFHYGSLPPLLSPQLNALVGTGTSLLVGVYTPVSAHMDYKGWAPELLQDSLLLTMVRCQKTSGAGAAGAGSLSNYTGKYKF